MADYKPQGKSRQGPKVVGAREITYNGSDVHSNGMSEVGFLKGSQDHLSSPVITHTDGKGNSFPSILAPVGTILAPSHNHAPNVQTDTARAYKTGPLRNLYWWRKPNSNAMGGIHDNGRPAANAGISNYTRPQDSSKLHQQYDTRLGRNMVSDGKESTMTATDGRAMSTPSKEAPSKGIPLTKPTNIVEPQVIVAQPQVHVLPPVVLQATIDSREAERRYGGLSAFPAEAYVPAIDSREAAWKYRGQML
ncbi:hypothetical protein AQUCO_00300867v1 [Aquilegia coerulea]|uniref:Uncharacterized protein n=1 Tax=Aquilegia coerulea TaxID=218851 RepID=A0A2G5F0U6_AQUCA|nr:hypothetical protein AQUCO_00300867v1 [Aquilegia coerulea]